MSWISIDEKLPPVDMPVLLGHPSWPHTFVGKLISVDPEKWLGFLEEETDLPYDDPTHWQPMPELPEAPRE